MQFVIDNYIWFIVGGVILLMAIIGYFADKSNFGKKAIEKKITDPDDDEPKSKKEKKSKKNKEEEVVSEIPVVEQVNNGSVITEIPEPIVVTPEPQIIATPEPSVEPTVDNLTVDIPADLYKPLDSTAEITDSITSEFKIEEPQPSQTPELVIEQPITPELVIEEPVVEPEVVNTPSVATSEFKIEEPQPSQTPELVIEQPTTPELVIEEPIVEPIASEPEVVNTSSVAASDLVIEEPKTVAPSQPETESAAPTSTTEDDIWKF